LDSCLHALAERWKIGKQRFMAAQQFWVCCTSRTVRSIEGFIQVYESLVLLARLLNAFLLELSKWEHHVSHISRGVLQPLRWRYVDCVIHHERDVCEEEQYIYVARTNNNRVISSGELYCCLLPQCEALRTCRLDFSDRNRGKSHTDSQGEFFQQSAQLLETSKIFPSNSQKRCCNTDDRAGSCIE